MAEKHWNNDNQSMIDLNSELVKSQLSGASVWLFVWNEKKQNKIRLRSRMTVFKASEYQVKSHKRHWSTAEWIKQVNLTKSNLQT